MEGSELTALRRLTRAARIPRDRLAMAGLDIPWAVFVMVYVQLAAVALLLLYWLFCLALYFDQGAAETDMLL